MLIELDLQLVHIEKWLREKALNKVRLTKYINPPLQSVKRVGVTCKTIYWVKFNSKQLKDTVRVIIPSN